MKENVLIFIIAFAITCVIIYFQFFTKSAVIKNKIKKFKEKKIGEVKDGEFVSIKGKVVLAGRSLTAPLSLRKCAYYHISVKDSSSSRETFKNYIDIEEEKVSDIVVFDGEHYAVIDTKILATYAYHDNEQRSGFWDSTTNELKAFLKKHGERTSDYIGWSLDLCATEGVLEEGEKVAIAGKASWRDAKLFKIKIPSKKVLYIESINEHGVYITDDIGGTI